MMIIVGAPVASSALRPLQPEAPGRMRRCPAASYFKAIVVLRENTPLSLRDSQAAASASPGYHQVGALQRERTHPEVPSLLPSSLSPQEFQV